MLELLKKFEEESTEMEDLGIGSDDEDDLARRFQDVDLNSTSTDHLWSKLTPSEQKQFMKALEDPTSELAQRLLASQELENDRHDPWWEAPVTMDGVTAQPDLRRRHGPRPDALRVPSILVTSFPNGPPLIYNMCAICIAYSYTTRHLAISPLSTIGREAADIQDAQQLISHLVPFLSDRKSTTLYQNLSRLIPELWSRFKPGEMNSTLFSLLLHDTSRLIRPLPVTMATSHTTPPKEIDPTSHPHLNLILVLSDLSRLFELCLSRKVSRNHVTHKLMFYAAHVLSTPSPVLSALVEEIMQMTHIYESEISAYVPAIPKEARAAIIEEI